MAEPMKIRATLQGDMVDVRVAVEHDLDVAHLEPELLDVRRNHRRHLRRPGVDQDAALRRDHQIRRDILRAHVVDVSDQPERLLRLAVRTVELRALLGRQRRRLRGEDDRTCKDQNNRKPE